VGASVTTAGRIIVRYFGGKEWDRLASVLRYTIAQHCQDWLVDVERVQPADLASPLGSKVCVVNTQKLDYWAAAVKALPDGERVLLLDADTAILRSLDDVWDRAFDVAYTTKPEGSRMPFNAGVMFLRVSPATRAFMDAWVTENRRMFEDPAWHQVWRPAYVGMNQSALGYLLHHRQPRLELNIARLPCLEWNLEDEHWSQFEPSRTRIVHYKSALRDAMFKRTGPEDDAQRQLIKLWRDLEGECLTTVA
jgi:hypothetical protein